MRRFQVLSQHGTICGEGIEWRGGSASFMIDATRGIHTVENRGRAASMVDGIRMERGHTLRFLDPPNDERERNPPAAWTGEGDPVYSTEHPPPPEGKLPSERYYELRSRNLPEREIHLEALLEVMNEEHRERLGRRSGT